MKLVEMNKFPMIQYFKKLYKQYSKHNSIIKQSMGGFVLNITACHCCSYLWTRTIKLNIDYKQWKVYTSSRESSDATPLDENFTNFTAYTVITYLNYDIYAEGYIVFIFPLILCPLESLFIR